MFLDDKPNYQALDLSIGRPTGFKENFDVALDQQILNESMRGFEAKLGEYEQENAKLASKLSGENISLPRKVVRSIREGNATNESIESQKKRYRAKLTELKAIYPEIKSYEEIVASIQKEAQELELKSADIQNRSTGSGAAGAFAGAMVGSFNPETDPVNVATLGVGGVGKSIALKIATEAGANAAVESINQFTGVATNRQQLGLENSSSRALTNILAAGVGAGALRGLGEGGKAGINALKKSDIINLKASDLLKKINPRANNSEDIAIINALEREAMDETIQSTTPKTNDLSYQRMAAAENELNTGTTLDADPFVFSRSDAEIEFKDIADTFDFDVTEKLRIESEVRKYGNFQIDEAEALAGQPVKTLNDLAKEVVEKTNPQVRGSADKIKNLLDSDAVIRSVAKAAYERGYFPEYKNAKTIEPEKLRAALNDEANGVYRYDANVRDALESQIDDSQRHYDEYLESKTATALDNEARLAKEYEKTEIAELDRSINEIREAGNKSISIERADGTFEKVQLSKLLDELDDERATLDAMKVCSL